MAIKLKTPYVRTLVKPLLIFVAILVLLLIVEPPALSSIISKIKSPFSQPANKIQQVESGLKQGFDRQSAKQAGYSDQEIDAYLQTGVEPEETLSEDGRWKWSEEKSDWIPNTKSATPSERALKVTSLYYTYSNEKQRNEMVKTYAGEDGDIPEAIRNLALFLDEEPEKIILAESIFEKIARNESRPNITLPSVQQPSINFPTHCTSNTIFDSTYTNCY